MTQEKLLRTVGLKEVFALTINGVIGAGIFALPASAAKMLGFASPLVFIAAGIFSLTLVLCFAELAGFYDRTGGAYLYASEAFGGTAAFLIGWMYFLARLTSSAALSNALVGFLGYFFNVASPVREIIILCSILILSALNYIGIRFSTSVMSILTVMKMVPLLLFIGVGLFFVPWQSFQHIRFPTIGILTTAVLPIMYAFTGFEVIAIPSAEFINPKRNLPLGILLGTTLSIVVYVLIQTVAVSTDPHIGSSQAPLAEAASVFLGRSGGSIVSIGAAFSTIGTLLAILLVAPRIIYSMALHDQLPRVLAAVHARFRTPHMSIIAVTLITLPFALSSSFIRLATLSAMARLITYIGSALALLVLRKKKPSKDTFRIPGGPTIPVIAILLCLFFLTGATRKDWIAGSIAAGIGLLLYAGHAKFLVPRKPQL